MEIKNKYATKSTPIFFRLNNSLVERLFSKAGDRKKAIKLIKSWIINYVNEDYENEN